MPFKNDLMKGVIILAKYFTSDWHIGDPWAPNTRSFLRPYPTHVMAERWLEQCGELLKSGDELYILGDLAASFKDLDFYYGLSAFELGDNRRIHILCGNKETDGELFTLEEMNQRLQFLFGKDDPSMLEISTGTQFVEIGGKGFRMAHKPEDLFGFAAPMPSLCGHVHGIWRTQCLPNGMPIINVGIDAWGGLVSEAMILHECEAIVNGHYDKNARVDLWKD